MKIVVVLHNIRSVHNVGSIFRTADAAGVEKVIVCGITPTPLDRFNKVRPDFAKVSLGAEKAVAWERAANTSDAIKLVRSDGYRIFAVEQSKKSIPYYDVFPKRNLKKSDRGQHEQKIALVLGNEVEGLSSAILKEADTIVEIPMSGAKESLNVAVAFGIVVFGLRYV